MDNELQENHNSDGLFVISTRRRNRCRRHLRCLVSCLKNFHVRNIQLPVPRKPQPLNQPLPCQTPCQTSPLTLLCWSLFCGPRSSFVVSFPSWPIFEVPSGPGLWFHAGLRPPVPFGSSSDSLWPVPWLPLARPLVPFGPFSGSLWPVLWFPLACSLVPFGPSSMAPPPGYLSRVPCSPCFGSGPSSRTQDCLLSYL